MFKARHLLACAVLLVAGVVHAGEPINTADAETLASAISGVGIKKAREIIAYRQQNGPFTTVDDLTLVSGIGTQTVEKSRDNLTVKTNGD
jgi:competence protein ComEA